MADAITSMSKPKAQKEETKNVPEQVAVEKEVKNLTVVSKQTLADGTVVENY